jgi:hypothetical protein
MSVDAQEMSKDQLVATLTKWCNSKGVDPARYIKKIHPIIALKFK